MELTLALVAAAASLGAFHTVAPDHWVPFAALARTERWSAARTAAVTAVCGLGHVTVSVALGLLGALFGLEMFHRFGQRLESVAGFLLIGFGIAYGLWGWHRAVQSRWHVHGADGDVDAAGHGHGGHRHDHDHAHGHTHWHAHGHHHHHHAAPSDRRMTAWTLFLLFSADPCVAVIPLMFAAAPLGWASTLAVVVAYEAATIGTMVSLVLPARAVAGAVRGAWADRYGDALAGGIIAAVGIAVVSLGI
jgi:ABC-type nickel/cobalt efflux system permease component RcnA